MKHLFLLTFLIVFIFFGNELGYTDSIWSLRSLSEVVSERSRTVEAWKHLTYNFQHANLWHLLINSISFYLIFKSLQKHIKPLKLSLLSLSVATVASFFVHYEKPCVGASAMIYAMIGIYLALIVQKRVIYRQKKHLYIFLSCLTIMLTLSFFLKHSAAELHLLSIILSFSVLMLINFLKKNKSKIC